MNWPRFAVPVLALTADVSSTALSDVKVVVYDGPKECSNSNSNANGHAYTGDGDGRPTRVERDHVVGLHFTVTIDASSRGSRDVLGKTIESSRDAGIAPSFPVGQGKVVEGLDRGLVGLCKGSSAYIIVPPHLAYGSMGKPEQGVGSDTTLRYDVEILDIQPPVPNDFAKIDANNDWEISWDEAAEYFGKLNQPIDLQGLWDEEDQDGDGYISWEEFTGPKGSEGPPAKRRQQRQQREAKQPPGQQQDVAAIFRTMDLDDDGKISQLEMADFFATLGQDMPEGFWTESDPDGDGYVLFEEFMGSG